MANNSTNINKTNNYLSPQKDLFHMKLEIMVLAEDRHINVSGLNRSTGFQFHLSW